MLADRDLRIAVLQIVVEDLPVLLGPLEYSVDSLVGGVGQLELGDDVGARCGPVGARGQEAFGVGVAAAARDPDLAGAQRAAQLAE